MNQVKAYIERTDSIKNIEFLGTVNPNKIPKLLNTLDLLVVPSITKENWREQIGRVIVESFTCGIPVIGLFSEAIPHITGEGGLIYEERNIDQLVPKIDYLINNPSESRELSRKL